MSRRPSIIASVVAGLVFVAFAGGVRNAEQGWTSISCSRSSASALSFRHLTARASRSSFRTP